MQWDDALFYIPFLAFVAFFLFRLLKHGGLRGAMYGSKVARTIGEIDLGRRSGAHTTLRVHLLENGEVVVEQSMRAMLGASIQGAQMSKEHAKALLTLLKVATDA